ncbi:MAG: STAS domain-containing protein [Vulcanimicrobiaceae bacterium]
MPVSGALAFLEGEAVRLARANPSLALDIDQLPVLDAPTIARLIALLRIVRERGGTIRLAVSRPQLLETIRATALNKIFDVISPAAGAPAPAAASRRTRIRRPLTAAIALIATCLAAGPSAGSARTNAAAVAPTAPPADLAPLPAADAVIRNIATQNPSIQTYKAHVDVVFRLKTFPYLGQRLTGTTYFKRPDNFEVVFDRVPSYAKGFDRLYSDIGDPSNWEQLYHVAVVGYQPIDHRSDLVVRLVKRQRGMIDHEDVLVDPRRWHIDRMSWHYYNGGEISMTQEFRDEGGYSVLVAQHATIRIPHVSALAESAYSNYETNVAIDDGVFTKHR